jgi:hypothetical protein
MAQDIADEISGNLNAGQDLLLALVITEDAVAATKVVAGPDAVAVFGIAASEGGVVAGAVVATDEGVAAVEAVAVPFADDSDATGGSESGDGDDQS